MRAILAAALCLAWTTAAQAADCGLKQAAAIDIQVSDGRIVVPVTFGDVHKNLSLRLESGLNGIFQATAKELNLRARTLGSYAEGVHINRDGQDIKQVALAPEFKLGQATWKGAEFLVLPPQDPLPSELRGDVVGDLGTTLFSRLDFELDIAHSKFNLFLPDHCPGQVVYWTHTGSARIPFEREPTGHILADMELDGKKVRVNLRTTGPSAMGMNAMRRLFGLDETAPGMTLVDTSSDGTKFYRYPFKTLAADGLQVGNPFIYVQGEAPDPRAECNPRTHFAFADRPPLSPAGPDTLLIRCFGSADLNIGLSVLSKLRLYYSSKEKTIYATGAAAN